MTDPLVISTLERLNAHLDKGIDARVAAYGGTGSVADAIKKMAALGKSLGI
jgi:hypothetical protein